MKQVQAAEKFSMLHMFKWFKIRRDYKKFCKTINAGSPSFGVLWNFAEFIQYAEIIYTYNNSKNSNLYSSRDYTPGQSGFRINLEKLVITVKLWSDQQKVGIDIENKTGNNVKTNYSFTEGQWTEEPDEYDVLLIDRVIGIINDQMLWMLNWCIDEKLGIHGYIDME